MPAPDPAYPEYRPSRRGYGGDGISPRKIIFGAILILSIIAFFLILFVSVIAVIEEGSPRFGRHLRTLAVAKHLIARVLHHL